MATGKVRIFELAKELGISSKELISLFERLGLEAKNQLSVVDDKIADLVRGVLLRRAAGASKATAAAASAAPAPVSEAVSTASVAVAEPVEPVREAAPVVAAAPAPVPVAPPKPVVKTPQAVVEPVVAPIAHSPVPEERLSVTAPPKPEEPVVAAAAAPSPPPPTRPEAPQPPRGTPLDNVAVPSLRPVTGAQRRPNPPTTPGSGRPAAPVDKRPVAPAAEIPAAAAPVEQVAVEAAKEAPPRGVVPPPLPPRPRPTYTTFEQDTPTLRPVPSGQSSVARPRPMNPIPPRPGVTPRPGQPGAPLPPRPMNPPGAQAAAPGTAPGRPAAPRSNGPFRPLPPSGPRPFTPRPPMQGGGQGGGGNGQLPTNSLSSSPTPSSGAPGGRQGGRGHDRETAAAKKDREKELLLEKERQRKKRGSLDAAPAILPAILEKIDIPDVLTVQELATSMIVPAKDVIKELIKMGTMATINQNIPAETAIAVARKFGFEAIVKEAGDEVIVEQEEDRPEMLTPRPPVVTVLGHVDHGKTSLLDRIRKANVASGEAGGITQRIGAYTVEKNDRKITFIDTPGHEAFTAMRARGAKVTDVAILVVAADDGVMPQTLEAISHVKAADVPIVVAINKIDKENAQPDRVKSQLSDHGLQPVDWGGKTEMVMISAKAGIGIDELLETVLLEADLRELKANKNRRAAGVVIESALDRGRGAVATVLIQNGTLRVGDIVVVGGTYGKIRALIDDKGKQVKKAGPSIPVEIMGLSDVPSAGDALMVVSDERIARETAAKRLTRRRDTVIAASTSQRVSLESFMAMPATGGKKYLNLIIKADGQGSVEALRSRVMGLSNAEVEVRVILGGVGAITPNDVNLASASNAVLIGFNIRSDETVKRLAEIEHVDLRFYQVIYTVEDDLRRAMLGMLAPKFREIILGTAEVRELFKVSKIGTIAGCYVKSGKLTRNAKVRILRDSAIVFDGELESLRRFKDDVKEVADGYECGVQIAKFADLKPGDLIEAYTSELVAPEPQHA